MERKSFLKAFALAAVTGPMLIDSCKKDAATTGTTDTTNTTESTCVTTPTEEEGPFPYPGGEITNPLNRSAITGAQTGVPITFNFVVVNTNDNCNVVSGARVDIWHCNKDGYYSGYGGQPGILGTESYIKETWLRGYQLSTAKGVVQFTSIYPGWYSPRATHIHLEIFVDSVLKKQAQLAFPEAISDAVYVTSLYKAHGINPTTNSADRVFGDSASDLSNEMLIITGNVSSGYSTTYTIGLAL